MRARNMDSVCHMIAVRFVLNSSQVTAISIPHPALDFGHGVLHQIENPERASGFEHAAAFAHRTGRPRPLHSIRSSAREATMSGSIVSTARHGDRLAGFHEHHGVHAHERRARLL